MKNKRHMSYIQTYDSRLNEINVVYTDVMHKAKMRFSLIFLVLIKTAFCEFY